MSDPMKQAWNKVGDEFAALGRTMKDRYHGDEPGGTSGASQPSDAGTALRDSIDRLVAAARDFGDRAVEVVRDDDVRSQAKVAARTLNDAVSTTVEIIGEQVGGLFGRSPRHPAPSGQDGGDPAVVGVPPETRDEVRLSTTGLVPAPVDEPTDVDVAETRSEAVMGDQPPPHGS